MGNDYIDGIPMLKMGNLKKGGFVLDKLESVSAKDFEENKHYLLHEGDFLFNTRNTPELVGKSETWKGQLPQCIFNSNIMRVYFNDSIDSYYMSYFFESDLGWRQLKSISTGTTSVAAIYTKDLNKVKISVPPLKEQQKIAEILSSVDSQIDYTDKLIEKTRKLKKGLMQRLLTKGIGHTEFKMTEIGEIPVEWEVKRFSDISRINQGLQIAIEYRFKQLSESRLPYITIQYINDKDNIDNQFYIENANASVVCYEEDILMTRTGNTGFVVTNEHVVFHNNFFKVDFNREIFIKDFLVYYLKSKPIQKLILSYAGSTTIPDLKHMDFYRIPVIIPSIEEQIHIANIMVSVDNEIKYYENNKKKLEELKKALMQQLLTGKIRVKV